MTPTTSTIQQAGAGQLTYRKRKYQNSATSDNEFTDDESSPKTNSPSAGDDDKRAHHNELERRRRDHIKDHFLNLKTAIPLLEGEKSSRALILKRAVDYITMLQTQIKDYKSEVEELKRRNDNLAQQSSGLNLKPFLTSLQFQQQAAQPLFNAALTQQQQPLVSVSNVPVLPTATHTATLNPSPTTSTFGTDISGSLTNGLPNINGATFCQPSRSPQCNSATPIMTAANTNLLANLSTLLLQNPALIGQLQTSQAGSAFEPLTPPSSASLSNSQVQPGLSPELIDAQTRLLASSLALRERQFAANVVATNF